MPKESTLAVGSEVYGFIPTRMGSPLKGKIVAITSQPGKAVGVQLEGFADGHSCDRRVMTEGGVEAKSCLWFATEHLMSETQYAESVKLAKAQAEARAKLADEEGRLVLEIGPDGTKKIRRK